VAVSDRNFDQRIAELEAHEREWKDQKPAKLMMVTRHGRYAKPSMNETSLSLLSRLRGSAEPESWNRLVELYAPLIRAWLRKYEVQDSDAEDLMQEVLLAVSKDVRGFDHSGQPGAFRAWLKAILINRLRKFWRSRDRRPQARADSDIDARLAQLDDPRSEMSQIWNREHDEYVLRQLLALAEPHFAPDTWTAFCRVALEGAKPDVVAAELGISRNAVIIAKCRVLSRLRQESEGLIESSSVFFTNS
jgi:RNA polymerase sigma-70 factor (ECF subfamily)